MSAPTPNALKEGEPAYSTTEVARLTGATYRQLDLWDRTDLATPSLALAMGSGSARRYSEDDVRRISAIVVLLDAGISLQAIRRTFRSRRPAASLQQLAERIEQVHKSLELAAVS